MARLDSDLEQRIAMSRPGDTVRGLSFSAVLALVERKQGLEAAERLRGLLFSRPPVDFFSYPVVDFLRLLYGTAETLRAHYASRDEALRACGDAIAKGFFESAVGQTLLRLIQGTDPKRIYCNAPAAYSTSVSYGERDYQPLGERKIRLHFRGDMLPLPVHEGILAAALAALGREGRVVGTALGLAEFDFVIEWT
ncbi:DUF2378 family protein [Myxococcaceae bacterium JPH2]|nr:DUF2378 family protein [Myxococcaceae bacterium JPH2]